MIDFKDAVLGVVQGDPDAAQLLHQLRSTMPAEYERLVMHLYERGPRGHALCEQFEDRCDRDVLVLGRDLIARASEFDKAGWDA
jgi:hypothetical protein